ncbi:MAG: outer membrane protein assembly factor BamA [Candidatus Magnetoovum sp. WYHC-5]|nr:outer membrane protein assembly factor BamA [Candidatus Magnetoovum sp. WYHC-5]
MRRSQLLGQYLLYVFLFLVLIIPQGVYSQEPLVNVIEVRGLKRIEEGAIRSKISQKINEPLSREKISKDIKDIYDMGYFDNVKVETDFFEGGLKLTYVLQEKPTVADIIFYGNDKVEEDKLKEQLTISRGAIADTTLVQDNVQKLKDYYEKSGYYEAQVFPIIRQVKEGQVSLTFKITEGSKIKIKKVNINGNENLSDSKIKGAINTAKWRFYSFITGSGYVKREDIEQDIQKIQDLYLDNGFINIKVSEPDITLMKDKKGLEVTFTVMEGKQFKVADIRLEGYSAFPESELLPFLKVKAGDIFSKKLLTQSIDGINKYYSERGYATVSVTPDFEPVQGTDTVKLALNVEEGKIYHIGRIEITGNTKTKDKVIRREIVIDEGEKYDSSKIKRSYEKINNLQFFEDVTVSPKPDPNSDKVDLDIKVKEKSTGYISIGGGYSSVDKLLGMVSLTQQNLFGSGEYLKVSAEIGGETSLFEIDYMKPWLFDKPLSFSSSVYRLEKEYIEYKKRATGFATSLTKRFRSDWSTGIMYKLERVTVSDVDDTASSLLKDQIGTAVTSAITPTITRDSRDNYIDPQKGSRNSLNFTYAGIGGDNYFFKTELDSLWVFPVIWNTTYSIRGRVGYATPLFGRKYPVYERFYVGGLGTVRGFGFGNAGPVDEEGTRIGGMKELIFNNDFTFPIFPEVKLKGIWFVDMGHSFDDIEDATDFKYTTGPGLSWISPFGPIRIYYGYLLNKGDDDESQGRFEFSFGSLF